MPACSVCGFDKGVSETCINCGSPVLSPEDAKALSGIGGQKDIDAAIRTAQKISKAKPDFYLPKLRLAEAYQRKVRDGEKALKPLAERSFEEALAILPSEREAHFCAIETASRIGKLPRMKEAYSNGSIDVLFGKDCLAAIASAESGATEAKVGFLDRRKLAIAGSILALAAIGMFFLRPGKVPDGAPGDYPNSLTYIPGRNLVQNAYAEEGYANWSPSGKCTIGIEGSAAFKLEGDDGEGAQASQEITLPRTRPPCLLVLARTRCAIMPEDRMSGLPSLWGNIRDTKGQVIQWLQEYNMLHRAEAGVWGVSWGTFVLPPDAAYVTITLQQALRAGGTRKGNQALFDDVGVYLFNSAILARAYAEKYDGSPPSDEMLAEDAGVVPVPGQTDYQQDVPTKPEQILAQAKSMYDRIEVGMSIHQAGAIMGFDDRTSGWSKDFGWSMKPECVTLNVVFKDEKVAWVALSKDYEPGNRVHPGRILEEKGEKPR